MDNQNNTIPDDLTGLPDNKKAMIEKNFDQCISSTLYYNVYIKDGLENPLVRDRFGDFVRATHSELLASLLSFEEFCKKDAL